MSATQSATQVTGLSQEPIQQFLLYDAIDNGPALVFVADEKMNYIAINETACKILGYTRQEILTKQVTDLATAADAADEYEQMQRDGSRRGTAELRTKDGRHLTFAYSAAEVIVAHLPYYISIGFISQPRPSRVKLSK